MSKTGSSSGNESQGSSEPPIPMNRFQQSGNQTSYEEKETKDAMIYRIDMHGCPASNLQSWINDDHIFFYANEPPSMREYDHNGRSYQGTVAFNATAYNASEAKIKIRNGVLWITVSPKVPGINTKLTVDNMR